MHRIPAHSNVAQYLYLPELINLRRVKENTIRVVVDGKVYYHAAYSLYLMGLGRQYQLLDRLECRRLPHPECPNLICRFIDEATFQDLLLMAERRREEADDLP